MFPRSQTHNFKDNFKDNFKSGKCLYLTSKISHNKNKTFFKNNNNNE